MYGRGKWGNPSMIVSRGNAGHPACPDARLCSQPTPSRGVTRGDTSIRVRMSHAATRRTNEGSKPVPNLRTISASSLAVVALCLASSAGRAWATSPDIDWMDLNTFGHYSQSYDPNGLYGLEVI